MKLLPSILPVAVAATAATIFATPVIAQESGTLQKTLVVSDLVENCLALSTGGYNPKLPEQTEVLRDILQ